MKRAISIRNNLSILASLTSLGMILSASASAQEGSWATKARMLSPQGTATAGAINGQLYVVGGNGTFVESYDPLSNTWTARAPALTPRFGAAAAVINGKLYVVGGYINANWYSPVTTLEIYDPTTDSWSRGAPAPVARGGFAGGAINGKLYVTGGVVGRGLGSGCQFEELDIYNPADNSWTTGRPMPTKREGIMAAVIGGKLYVVGGFTRIDPAADPWGYCTGKLEVYDPTTDTWDTSKAPMPTARFYAAASVVNGKLHVVGGNTDIDIVAVHEVYDPATDTWTADAPALTLRWMTVAEVINGQLYMAAGVNRNPWGNSDLLEVYTPPNSSPPNPCESELAAAQAQITSLQSQLSAANSTIASLQNQLDTLTTQNSALSSQNNQLQTQVGPLTAQNAELQNQITSLATQKAQLASALAAATATIQSLSTENAQLQTQDNLLTRQLQNLNAGLNGGVGGLTQTLQSMFGNTQFQIPGNSPLAQFQSVVNAIQNLNPGQMLGLYKNLGGKPGNGK